MKKTFLIIFGLITLSFTFSTNFEIPKEIQKLISKAYAYVPSGEAIVGTKKIKVNDFFISITEVSNQDYLQYLRDLKASSLEKYQNALPDTTVWSIENTKNDQFMNQYLRYPGFMSYPVVGVSWSQATNYCKWAEGYLNKKLKGKAIATVRLPTEAEWVRAARGDSHTSMFTWGSPYAVNGIGEALANYKKDRLDLSSKKMNVNIITAEVFSFQKNKFGIYNMCGNVAELTQDEDIIKGGSWKDEVDEIKIDVRNKHEVPSNAVGFRVVVEIK